jgi:membrane-associated phospholipid phosphatase
MNATRSTPETAWPGRLGPRLKTHWRFKLVGGPVIAIAFFTGYFLLLNFPVFPVREMPATALDRLIAYQPHALLLYLSLYLYIPLAPWLLDNRRDLNACCLALSGLCLVGLLIFLFWPTAIPRPDSVGYRPLIAIDGPGNACPSLHAAFAVFSAICIDLQARRLGDLGLARSLSWLWCLGILYATLATKQHVAVDLFAGAVLGVAWAGLYLQFFHRSRKLQA